PYTVYSLPLYLHEFFHWLEHEGVKKVHQINAQHVDGFLFQLKKRPHAIHGGKISHAHINKYHQALVLLSQFVRQTSRGSFTVETERMPEKRHIPDILT